MSVASPDYPIQDSLEAMGREVADLGASRQAIVDAMDFLILAL